MEGSDLTLPVDGGYLNLRVGAIIIRDGKILMVKNTAANYCYSVGGRIRFGETAEDAVRRETAEETGAALEIDRPGFLHENFFYSDAPQNYGALIQEISVFFYMKTPADFTPVCRSVSGGGAKETLVWISPADDILCYPAFLKTAPPEPAPEMRHIVTDERIGLRKGTVMLGRHQSLWEEEARNTICALNEIFRGKACDIQHVGSTSIPSIMAKPIIDIAVAVGELPDVTPLIPAMEAAGFYFRPADDLPRQMLFAKGPYYDGTGDTQTHFIHVVKAGSREWNDYLNFRDYLRSHPDTAKEYEALKLRLALAAPIDRGREKYLAGKHDFITKTLHNAAAWRNP